MRKDKALKAVIGLASLGLLLGIPSETARAESSVSAEQGVAGITYSLDNYYVSVADHEPEEAEETLSSILKTEVLSPYRNLGVSIADNYVNIRKEPSTESEIVGKLYRGCAADILERLEGGWVKIKSGDVEGYIASNYLAIGKAAESMVDEYATKYATVDTTTLNVREKQSTDSKILTQIPLGETYVVVNEYEKWAEILLGNGDDTQSDFTGFVSKDHIHIDVEFKFAISIEEERAIKRAQEEAERAERERKEKLAREKEERRKAEEAAKKAEQERKAAEKQRNSSNNSSSSSSSSSSQVPPKPSKSSSDVAALQQEIVNYALKFVGNRYVFGGTSLTNGADCSGFVWRIYQDFGYSIPRVSADQAVSAGRKVSLGERQPGDLLFYTNSSGRVSHVAMYIGNNRIVHAANSRQGIITSQYNYRDVYTVRRIVN
ncbi:MAG TPA: hydrolase Nlp/P60 [Lachnospiraceae bacterium]|jgi:cell wall-associated NlpC family hydrolase|nr:hydrolase Nlp/P60 [Lachnospiraceae bacterium]HCA70609.1 hydrolase Nlp/P60 [Lachnospiraceae bacterium]HCM13405.1 hydrolase Nlp/P60 [Lachnospiraceae bacterium]HCR40005.1 hydrolase Nlp/P60 [Lachnospiraceae bacterium]